MESDKENVYKTKIPLPLDPLPALPKHLFKENKPINVENIQQRCPLKTINSQTSVKAGPSKGKTILNKSRSFKIDTKHVTIRKRSEDLDWDYNIFKDKETNKDASIICVSDDETYSEASECNCVDTSNRLGEVAAAVTPLKACLESNRVRNLKRSLKRPHSRELQGLSPLAKEEKVDDKAKRRLRFTECIEDGLGTPDYWKRSYVKCLNRDYTNDVFDYLLTIEVKPRGVPRTTSIVRACVINWLMKVNLYRAVGYHPDISSTYSSLSEDGPNGNPATIQSACWYLDSILGTGHVQLDKLQLVAAACYWIAQKLQGPVAPAMRLVKCSKYAFTADQLLAAEKAILQRLQFPRQPVVPQDFITYFAWWCDDRRPGEIETAATFLCMSGLMVDKVLCEEYPSVIAAAAVRNALMLLRKQDLCFRLQMCPVYKQVIQKAVNLSYVCSILRRAVCRVAASNYEYKAPLEHYDAPPRRIAQRIVEAASQLSLFDVRNTDRSQFSLHL